MLWTLKGCITASTPWHAHGVFELILCLGGAGRLAIDGREIEFRPRRALVIAPDVRHRFRLRPGEAAELHVACLTSSDLEANLSPPTAAALSTLPAIGVAHADADAATTGVWETSALIPGLPGECDAAGLRMVWSAIGLLLTWLCSGVDGFSDPGNDLRRARFQPIRRWVDTHLDGDIRLDDLAARFGVSRSQITREFRRHTGFSVIEYCNIRRVENSAQRLADGDGSVAEVARASGFANLSHFHHQFKSIYGLTPAAFRRMAAGAGSGAGSAATALRPSTPPHPSNPVFSEAPLTKAD